MKIWMSPQEVRCIEEHIKGRKVMLEWGAGGSTLHFSKFVDEYYSIEHNKDWFYKVNKTKPSNVSMFLVENNEPRTLPTQKEQFIDYINFIDTFNKTFDAILVDGRARGWCAEKALDYIHSDSVVFVHDYFNRPNYHIVENWYNVVDSVKDTNQTLVVLKKK